MRVVGIDAAFANMGFAHAYLSNNYKSFHGISLDLVTTKIEDKKLVRKSSDDLRRAKGLHKALQFYTQGCQFAFVEVPSGSLSAAAARSLGIAVGVLASCPIPIIEVSPMEVKVAVTGDRKVQATKKDVIQWAVTKWPTADWLRDGKGRLLNSNEHLADALAVIVAGLETPAFKSVIAMTVANTQSLQRRKLI